MATATSTSTSTSTSAASKANVADADADADGWDARSDDATFNADMAAGLLELQQLAEQRQALARAPSGAQRSMSAGAGVGGTFSWEMEGRARDGRFSTRLATRTRRSSRGRGSGSGRNKKFSRSSAPVFGSPVTGPVAAQPRSISNSLSRSISISSAGNSPGPNLSASSRRRHSSAPLPGAGRPPPQPPRPQAQAQAQARDWLRNRSVARIPDIFKADVDTAIRQSRSQRRSRSTAAAAVAAIPAHIPSQSQSQRQSRVNASMTPPGVPNSTRERRLREEHALWLAASKPLIRGNVRACEACAAGGGDLPEVPPPPRRASVRLRGASPDPLEREARSGASGGGGGSGSGGGQVGDRGRDDSQQQQQQQQQGQGQEQEQRRPRPAALYPTRELSGAGREVKDLDGRSAQQSKAGRDFEMILITSAGKAHSGTQTEQAESTGERAESPTSVLPLPLSLPLPQPQPMSLSLPLPSARSNSAPAWAASTGVRGLGYHSPQRLSPYGSYALSRLSPVTATAAALTRIEREGELLLDQIEASLRRTTL
jgi:hypothetical protein